MAEEQTLPDFEESDFWVDLRSVQIGAKIGEGQFSSVYVGKYFGDLVAVKKQTRYGKDLEKYLLRELAVLKYIKHESLIEYLGAWNEVSELADVLNAVYIVTEFAQGGDLLSLLIGSHPLGWRFRITIAHDASNALAYLHSHHLIHRDIKSSNLLLNSEWKCKISDFGMTREVTSRMTICGTDEYMAPELLFEEEYDHSVDIFAFGMVLLELIARAKVGEKGFAERRPAKKFQLDYDNIRSTLPSNTPPELVELAIQCCSYEPGSRPSTNETIDRLRGLLDSLPPDEEPLPRIPPIPEMPDAPAPAPKLGLITTFSSPRAESVVTGSARSDTFSTATTPRVTNPNTNLNPNPPANAHVHFGISPMANQTYASVTPSHHTSPPSPKSVSRTLNENGGPTKTGWLYKRNKSGFRNWKRRYFVLIGQRLVWYRAIGELEPRGHIDLHGAIIRPTKEFRFQILDASEEDALDLSKLFHRELAADSVEVMEEWMQALNQAIHSPAPDEIQSDADRRQRLPKRLVFPTFATIFDWLNALDLSQYWALFQDKGYVSIDHLNEIGLTDTDLDYVGVVVPIHRRVLKLASHGQFMERLQIVIPEWRDFGSVTVYKVMSRYRFASSTVHLRYSDFNKLNSRLKECAKNTPLVQSFPELPGKGIKVIQDQRDPAFLLARRIALEDYLQSMATLFSGSEHGAAGMKLLLTFFELEPFRASLEANEEEIIAARQSIAEAKV